MPIRKVRVSNFKSFDRLEVELRPLNIVVGANAAGKSNFLEIFRFVRDVAEHGLENAVSLQGGTEYLTNLKIRASRPLSLEVVFAEALEAQDYSTWELILECTSAGFKVISHVLHHHQLIHFLHKGDEEVESNLRLLLHLIGRLALFDFDSKLPKKAVPVTGKADLEQDGSNLAIVLRNILQDEQRRVRVTRLLRDLLPFVDDLRVERFVDKSLLLSLRERFSDENYLPASFLSDGTIHLIALILALYFDRASVVVIEEPERNIHPHLISKVAAMLADASQNEQLIVTTQSPELVKHARLEDLLLVQRDAEGFSRISRPAESEELKVFLANDLGVDELYVQDLLGIGR
jgi:predicted ATPase